MMLSEPKLVLSAPWYILGTLSKWSVPWNILLSLRQSKLQRSKQIQATNYRLKPYGWPQGVLFSNVATPELFKKTWCLQRMDNSLRRSCLSSGLYITDMWYIFFSYNYFFCYNVPYFREKTDASNESPIIEKTQICKKNAMDHKEKHRSKYEYLYTVCGEVWKW